MISHVQVKFFSTADKKKRLNCKKTKKKQCKFSKNLIYKYDKSNIFEAITVYNSFNNIIITNKENFSMENHNAFPAR